MKIYSWTGEHPNFGDDLNHFLWEFLMPEVVADADDGALLVGVGTVLSNKLPAAKMRVVMGSGVGYSAAPRDISGPNWAVYAVRGPLTAKLLGLPADRAVIDPAVLLPGMPQWPTDKQQTPIFIPHWITAQDDDWRWAAAKTGLRYVDPRQDPMTVISEIARAPLVVAESMHAAIIADAFRVPWIPVIGMHRAIFKWQDWASSLSMDYRPHRVGLWARVQHRLSPNPQFTGNFGGTASSSPAKPKFNPAEAARSLIGHMPRPVRREMMVRDMAKAQRKPSQLSADTMLAGRQNLLRERIEQLREDYASGRIVSRAASSIV
ncbi:polysaccharide pyruvyl transferase family protein [Sphingomonas qilianensis]|uniref:Polysaccharide pyruvyl transferase family protein n=1 Tax=Sphingomonas qilianensis TaxID=1736690 RepID=A0ABU9XP35_9SPHN